MFRSARLKLTGWYLLIIMLISIFFSMAIYTIMGRELERGFRRVEIRLKAEELGVPAPRQLPRYPEESKPQLVEDLRTAQKRIVLNLLIANSVILGISATAGYFLAGKTLRPIEKAMAEQKRFVADASHEFRTPLTALKTSMEVALRGKKISIGEAKKLITSNLEGVDSMCSLADNLLSLAAYQNNDHNFALTKTNLAEVVKIAYKKILPLAKKKGVRVVLKAKDSFIQANKTSLEQMVLIFLDNAVKYTPKGGQVLISVKTDKKYAFLAIKDTGVGVAEKDLPYIFDRFYRTDQSRSKNQIAGFGLGLSLAKKIIATHKGSVKVISRIDKGTTFVIKLPFRSS